MLPKAPALLMSTAVPHPTPVQMPQDGQPSLLTLPAMTQMPVPLAPSPDLPLARITRDQLKPPHAACCGYVK